MCARWAACLMTLRRRLAILMIRGRAHSSLNWSSAYELRRAKEEVDHFVEHTMPTCANVRQCSQMCRSCAKCKGRDVGMGKLWHARFSSLLEILPSRIRSSKRQRKMVNVFFIGCSCTEARVRKWNTESSRMLVSFRKGDAPQREVKEVTREHVKARRICRPGGSVGTAGDRLRVHHGGREAAHV